MHVALFSPAWPLERHPNGVVTYVHWKREELRRVSAFTALLDEPEADVHAMEGSLDSASAFGDYAHAILCGGLAESQIDYSGGLDPQQIYPLRANAYLTIVASRWENQSYTALEAMAQGCPLVSSDAGGQSEFVIDGATGLLAKAGSDDELRERIATLLLDPHGAAELGRRAREHVLAQHSPAAVVARTLDVYEAAIGMGGKTR